MSEYAADPTIQEVKFISDNLRKQDVDELLAFNLNRTAIIESYKVSHKCFIAKDYEPVVLYGISPITLLGNDGLIWAVATERVKEYPIQFIKCGNIFIKYAHQFYDVLLNRVHIKNTLSIRFLKLTGFTLDGPVVHETTGEQYYWATHRR